MKRPNKRRKIRKLRKKIQTPRLQGSTLEDPLSEKISTRWTQQMKPLSKARRTELRRGGKEVGGWNALFLVHEKTWRGGSSLQLLSQSQQLAWSLWPVSTSFREQTCHQTYVCFIRVAALRKRQKNDPIKSHDLSIALWLKGWTGGTIFKVKIR